MRRLLAVSVLTLVACSGSDPAAPTEPPPSAKTFESVLVAAGTYENPTATGRTVGATGSFVPEGMPRPDGTSWICREKEVSLDEAPDEFILFRDAAFVNIYPGSLLQGATLENDPPSRVRANRGPGTVLIQLQTGQDVETSVDVPVVDPASINDAVNTLVGNRTLFPTSFSYDAVRVESSEELRVKMQLKTETWGADVEAKFSFDSDTSKERWLIKLVQPFYTIQFVPPNSTDDWFAADVTPEALEVDVQPGNPPVYVSTVTYGRIVYLLLETDATRSEVEASIAASTAVTSGSATTNYISTLKNSSIKALVYGGSMDIGALEGDFADAQNALADDQQIQLGKPISYTMADLRTENTVKVKLGDTFTVRDCVPFVGTTFSFSARESLGTLSADVIKTGDFNDDGMEDLLFSSIQAGQQAQWQVATSSGDGTFQVISPAAVDLTGIGDGATTVHVADLQGDGYDDVAWETQRGSPASEAWLTVVSNTDGTLSTAPESGAYCTSRPYAYWGQFDMHVGRFESPGKDALAWNLLVAAGQVTVQVSDDALWTTDPSGGLSLFNYVCPVQGDNGFDTPSWGMSSLNWSNYDPALVGDINGDGLDDLMFTSVSGDRMYLWHAISAAGGVGPPLLSPASAVGNTYPRGGGTWTVASAEVTNDAYADVVWVEASPGGADVFVGVAAGSAAGTMLAVGQDNVYDQLQGGPYEVRFANLDGIGASEVLLFRPSEPNNVFVLKNYDPSSGRFEIVGRVQHENPDVLSSAQWSDYDLRVLDVNGDGRDDLLWVRDDGEVYVALAEPGT